jgi:hypothetical protein
MNNPVVSQTRLVTVLGVIPRKTLLSMNSRWPRGNARVDRSFGFWDPRPSDMDSTGPIYL